MKAREVLEKYLDDITSGPGMHTVASLAEGAIYALANAGFPIVPIEPSEKMIEAYDKVAVEENGAHASLNNTAYAAMLQAAKEEG